MHWFFDYPWGPALTWLVVFAVMAVLAVSFYTVRREIWSPWGISVVGLRVLALVIVVFLLLQPQMKRVTSSVLQASAGVLIDTSKSMRVKDAGSTQTRLEIARELLVGEEYNLVGKLKEKGSLRAFQFGYGIEEVPLENLGTLEEAEGEATALGSALADAAERFGGEDLTALVVLTDGQSNAGRQPMEVAASLNVPVYLVGIGRRAVKETGEDKDCAVDNVVYDRRVMVNRSTDVQVSLSARGFPNRTVQVQLLQDEKLIGSAAVALGPAHPKAEAVLKYAPQAPGKYVYTVKVPLEQGEIDAQNNQRLFTVQVIDPVNRVLYVEESPRWEQKFIKRVINENRNLDVLALVKLSPETTLAMGGPSAASAGMAAPLAEGELEQFKLVVIGDVGRAFFTGEQLGRIAKFVENGGSVVLLGGKQSFGVNGFVNTPLAPLLPVAVTPTDMYNENVSFGVALTPDGAAHPIFQHAQMNWSLAPELKTFVSTGKPRAGATVLLTSADGAHPLVVVQQYGQGKSAVVLTDSLWRWKLGQANQPLPLDIHQFFWTSLIEWLLPEQLEGRKAKSVELMTDKDEYELNEQVHFVVLVTDADGSLARDAAVRLETQTPDRKTVTLQATLGEISAYSTSVREGYTSFYTPHRSGKHTTTAVAERGGQEIGREEVSFLVGDPALEFRATDINEELLKDLGPRTGGHYYTPETVGTLADDIASKEKTITKTEQKEVWNEWWVLVTFVALMTSEWIVRKRRQMA